MPAKPKGARLWFRPGRKNKGYQEKGVWVILDGKKNISTGCSQRELEEANRKLADYIAAQYQPCRIERDISDIMVADVLSIYLDDRVPHIAAQRIALGSLGRLNEFFGDMTLAEVNGKTCKAYAQSRVGKGRSTKGSETGGGARRDLQTLAAAINYHAKQGLHRGVVKVALPAAGEARTRWMDRGEMAKLLWMCWRTREIQEGKATGKRPLRHLVRLLLLGVYTGSRPGAMFSAAWMDGPALSFIDVDRGVFHRHAEGKRKTNKRQPPVRLSDRLLAHLRRWRESDLAKGQVHVITFDGMPIENAKTALSRACELAGVEHVTAYTLRHTCASWLVSKGMSTRMVAEYLGTSEAMIQRHYGHLHPDYQRECADAIGRK